MPRLLLGLLALLICYQSALATDGAELATLEIVRAIEQDDLNTAEKLAHDLTQDYPSFSLGHQLYGDTLALKEGLNQSDFTLNGEGEFSRATLDQELKRRLQRASTPPPENALPANIVKLSPEQPYVLLNDLSNSRLYIFENKLGEPRLITDHYIGIGKAGYDKQYEGDHKTPLGVYAFSPLIPDEKLPDLYGAGAYPLNYPNAWDRLQQRTGHGIWVHGVPSAHYNRPPLSSEGCITVNNTVFETLASYIQPGNTINLNVENIEWVKRTDWNQQQIDMLARLEQWRAAWSSLDTDRYLDFYSPSFNSGRKNHQQWSQHKRRVNQYKSFIDVELSQVSMFQYAGEKDTIQINFRQHYKSSNLSGNTRKSQLWKQENGQWKIIYEGQSLI